MPLYEYDGKRPRVDKTAFVSDSAVVIGDVSIGKFCYIGHGAIIRGDYGTVVIEDETAVEEGVVIHVHPGGISRIGKRVTIGHGAIVHSVYIGDEAVIGMGAILSIKSRVGEGAIVAEGTLVPSEKEVPPGKVVMGNPFKIVGDVKEKHKEFWSFGKKLYVDLAKKYPKVFRKL